MHDACTCRRDRGSTRSLDLQSSLLPPSSAIPLTRASQNHFYCLSRFDIGQLAKNYGMCFAAAPAARPTKPHAPEVNPPAETSALSASLLLAPLAALDRPRL